MLGKRVIFTESLGRYAHRVGIKAVAPTIVIPKEAPHCNFPVPGTMAPTEESSFGRLVVSRRAPDPRCFPCR
jgi:hypothetical protein